MPKNDVTTERNRFFHFVQFKLGNLAPVLSAQPGGEGQQRRKIFNDWTCQLDQHAAPHVRGSLDAKLRAVAHSRPTQMNVLHSTKFRDGDSFGASTPHPPSPSPRRRPKTGRGGEMISIERRTYTLSIESTLPGELEKRASRLNRRRIALGDLGLVF